MRLITQKIKLMVDRKISSEGTELALPEIEFFGDFDSEQQDQILSDVHQYEESYFSLNEKLSLKKLLKLIKSSPSDTPAKTEAPAPVRQEYQKPVESDLQSEEPAKRQSEGQRLQQTHANASRVYLREVGAKISGTYLSSGNRKCGKEARFVVYLNSQNDGLCYLAGTQLQEVVHGCKEGDYVEITKTKNYRKAKDRKHASPSIFDLKVVETASAEA